MRAAGVEVNDSFDSSEGVGFTESVTNVDDGVLGSTLSLESFVSREEEGGNERLPLQLGELVMRPLQPGVSNKSKEPRSDAPLDDQKLKADTLPGANEAHFAATAVEEASVEQSSLAIAQTASDETLKEADHVTSHNPAPSTAPPPLDYAEVINSAESGDSSAPSPPPPPPPADQPDLILPPPPPPLFPPPPSSQDPAIGSGGSPSVAVYIAKYSYNPSEMSPNQNPDLELSLTAGDYLYVFGEMDEDGFYHGQLMSGDNGLVPSNFIEVVEEGDEASPVPPRKALTRRRLSNLQDIEEEDEKTTSTASISAAAAPPPPPRGLQLERQFVDGDSYSVAIHWDPPSPLPPQTTGYAVYVNGKLAASLSSSAGETNVVLTGVPRQQLVKIAVRTVAKEGESPDPDKLIVLNPQYPEPPSDVTVSTVDSRPRALQVQWSPSPQQAAGGGGGGENPITHFNIYLSGQHCIQLAASATPSEHVCAQLYHQDLKKLNLTPPSSINSESGPTPPVLLTVRACAGRYESQDSSVVVISAGQLAHVMGPEGGGAALTVADIESATSSLDSPSEEEEEEEEREVYSPANRATPSILAEGEGADHVSREGGHVTNGGEVVANHADENQTKAPPVVVRYYKALFAYDPYYHSPNEEGAEDELSFEEGDIIMAKGETDEDGFFEGQIGTSIGYVPSNMVEEVTDPDELAQVKALLAVNQQRRNRTRTGDSSNVKQPAFNGQQAGEEEEGRGGQPSAGIKMKALFDYDPKQDSPNENSEAELSFAEGDVITVFGQPDPDGYFQARFGDKTGLVPQNFVRDLQSPDRSHDQSHDELRKEEDVGIEVFAAHEESMKEAQKIIDAALEEAGNSSQSAPGTRSTSSSSGSGSGKSLLSKGKALLGKSSKKKGN